MKFLSLSPQKPWIARSKKKRRMRRTSETPKHDHRETDSPRSVSTEREHRIERLGWKNYGCLSRIQSASATRPLPPPHRKQTRTVPDGRTRSAQPDIRQEISAKGRSNISRLAVTTKRKPRCRHLQRGLFEVWSGRHKFESNFTDFNFILSVFQYFTAIFHQPRGLEVFENSVDVWQMYDKNDYICSR